MATYQAITSGQIDADSYIDIGLSGQWTNNLLAVIEGDPSASSMRIIENAHSEIVNGSNYRIAQISQEYIVSNGSYARVPEMLIVVPRSGIYQISAQIKSGSSLGSVFYRLYVNKSTVYSGEELLGIEQSTTSTSYVEKTDSDIALNAGDVLIPYVKTDFANSSIKDLTLQSNTKLFG